MGPTRLSAKQQARAEPKAKEKDTKERKAGEKEDEERAGGSIGCSRGSAALGNPQCNHTTVMQRSCNGHATDMHVRSDLATAIQRTCNGHATVRTSRPKTKEKQCSTSAIQLPCNQRRCWRHNSYNRASVQRASNGPRQRGGYAMQDEAGDAGDAQLEQHCIQ